MLVARYAVVVVVALALLLPPPAAATLLHICDDGSSYTANGTFQLNLDLLAAALPANASASPAGFATASVGAEPDQANGLVLCRGDTNASACAACVAAALRDAQRACPRDKGVTVYRDACVLRVAGSRFLDFLRGDQWLTSELNPFVDKGTGSVNASEALFSAAVMKIFTALVDRAAAAAGNSTARKYFATAEMEFDPKIYGLAQCAPDLTPAQCQGCLGDLLATVTTRYLSGRPPWNSAFVVWCSLRYSVSPVFDGPAMMQLPAPPAPPPAVTLVPATPESGAGRKRIAAGIFAGIACSMLEIIFT